MSSGGDGDRQHEDLGVCQINKGKKRSLGVS